MSVSLLFGVGAFAQTSLTLYPQQVSLTAPVGSATATQWVALNTTGQNVNFAAAVRYLSPAGGWLFVSPATGTTPAILTISASSSNLAAGTYVGQVTVAAGTVGGVVNVLFTVASVSGGGSLGVSPSGLTFFSQSGSTIVPAQTLSVTSTGAASVAFSASASSSGNWLTVFPQTATTPATLTVVPVAPNAAGKYTGTITITPLSGGNPTVAPVTLIVRTGGSPVPSLTLSHTALRFNHQIGTLEQPAQAVGLRTNGGTLSYTATTTASWLTLATNATPTPSGSVTDLAPGFFSAVASPTGLGPGTYIETITVRSADLPDIALPVSLTVTVNPTLNADPSSLVLDSFSGLGIIYITSTGSANLQFTAAASVPWFTVSPTSASTPGGFAFLTITPNSSGLAAGRYDGAVTLTVQDSGTSLVIPVALTVSGAAAQGVIETYTTSVELVSLAGGANPSRTVYLTTNPPGTTHEFTAVASSAGGWLSVAPFSGTISANPATPLTIGANAAAVPSPGTYKGVVTITSLVTGQQVAIEVSFLLNPLAIVAEPAALSFVQEQRGVAPPPRTILVTANAQTTFRVVVSPNWIKVGPLQGVVPSVLNVSVDPGGLPGGPNSGSFQIIGPNNQLTIPVSLTVLLPPSPTATPGSIALTYELGSPAPQPRLIAVGSTAEPIRFTAAATTESGVKWLTVAPTSGSTPTTLVASVNTAQLVPGKHSGVITVASAEGSDKARNASVSITLDVSAPKLAIQTLLHGATRAVAPIAPGQMLTITGTGLGPVSGLVARPTAAGAFETRLGDMRVLFDGVPAPLLSVRIDEILAIVPYAIHGRASARIQVEAGASLSIPIEAKVADAVPGLFTSGNLGRGQAAALNADFTLNSVLNPAPRGSAISVFGTGEGQTDPPGQDGRIITVDLRRPLLPVTATIGGRPAEVTYAGSASGQVSGLFQINVSIPDDVEPGAVPIQIQVGGAMTQSGVTIAVR